MSGVLSTLGRPPGAGGGGDDDGDGDDEMLPAMADDDYSAQLSFQSQSKDNLKYVLPFSCLVLMELRGVGRVLMDNFSPAQYDRFEAYRRHALPKAAVRKVCNSISFPLIARGDFVYSGHPTNTRPTSLSARRANRRGLRKGVRWRNRRKRYGFNSHELSFCD